MDKQLSEIQDKVRVLNLHISGIMPEVRKQFLDLANRDFKGDYKFTLKFLLDLYNGTLTTPESKLQQQIDNMAEDIQDLKEETLDLHNLVHTEVKEIEPVKVKNLIGKRLA